MCKNWGSYSQRKSLFNNLLHRALKVSDQNTDPVRLVAKIEPNVQSYLASANFSEDRSANRKRSMILRAAGKEQPDRKRRRYWSPKSRYGAICSAIAYAEFKRKLGMPDVVAARAGNTNERIDFVLERFGFPAPDFVSDLTPKVADLMDTTAISVPHDSSVYEAIRLIRDSNLRALPVVDAKNRCVGVLSGWKISHYLFPPSDEALDLGLLVAAIGDVVNSFKGKYLAGHPDSSQRRLVILVGAMSLEILVPRLKRDDSAEVVLFVGDREDIQLAAIAAGALAVVVTGG